LRRFRLKHFLFPKHSSTSFHKSSIDPGRHAHAMSFRHLFLYIIYAMKLAELCGSKYPRHWAMWRVSFNFFGVLKRQRLFTVWKDFNLADYSLIKSITDDSYAIKVFRSLKLIFLCSRVFCWGLLWRCFYTKLPVRVLATLIYHT
jgi:hypothetical protein